MESIAAAMSILYSSDEGWIISHLDYLQNIYRAVEDEHEIRTLKFNETIFKVNSQYLRQNQIESCKKAENNRCSSKSKKRKDCQTLSQDILEQNDFVKKTSAKIFDGAKHLKLFTNSFVDNNEESRLESKKFYLNGLKSSTNYHGNNPKENAIIAEFQNEKYVFPKNCKFYCYDVKEINEKINTSDRFDLILLDPPWWNKSIRRKKQKFQEGSYKMMYNEELANIPLANLLNPNGIIAVWCTNSPSQVKSVLEEMFPAWGIIFKVKWSWLKVTQSGDTICNFNEVHGKQPYEQLLFGTASLNVNFNVPDNKIVISIPSAVHSHKPPLTDILKSFLPENPKCLEIFARYLLPEWTSWGLEVLKFQHLSLYTVTENESVPVDKKTGR